jgi:tRNA dimethylallyltransferase
VPDLIVIVGPTAAGKTAAALAVAAAVPAEVVSADAVQIYRGLDIGSAKPTAAERAAVPHHLVDVADPTETYSAARYVAAADDAIRAIQAAGRTPLVVGGCGLYVKALLYGLCEAPPADPGLRAALVAEEARLGPGTLHARLAGVDPPTAARLHPADQVRIVRALEVQALTGRRLSDVQASHGFSAPRYPAVVWGLDPGRDVLADRIERRVRQMMNDGFMNEVERLLASGVPDSAPGLQSPGYRELVRHLHGDLPLDEALRLTVRAHRHYARRQRTWFRKTAGLTWYARPEDLPVSRIGSSPRAT